MKKKNTKLIIFIVLIPILYLFSFFISNSKLFYYGNIGIESVMSNEDGVILKKDEPYTIECNKYIQYLDIYSNSNDGVDFTLTLYKNGEVSNTYERKTNKYTNYNSTKIGTNVEKIDVVFNQDININNISINNDIRYISYFQIGLFITFIGLLVLIMNLERIKDRPEIAFLIISITAGVIFIFATPVSTYKSYDDQIHFDSAYSIAEEYYSESAIAFKDIDTRFVVKNINENIKFMEYLNANDNNYTEQSTRGGFSVTSIAYIPFIAAYKLRAVFHFNWVIAHYLGLICSFAIFVYVVYVAIKITPIGKYIMLSIALIPTSLFLASQYSYDPPIIGFLMLGFAFSFKEIYSKSNTINKKNLVIALVSFLLAAAPKPIYIPLILILLFIPTNKIESKRKCILFSILLFVLAGLMMFTFALPMLVGGMASDIRGGEGVNSIGQIKFILHNPIKFIGIFSKNIYDGFVPKFITDNYMQAYGYLELQNNKYNIFGLIINVIMFLSILVSSQVQKKYLSKNIKIFMWLIVLAIICMIWGSMYIVFTPVGSSVINGVQSRYFIPLMYPVLMLFISDKIKLKVDIKTYNKIISILLFISIFGSILTRFELS